MHLEELGLTTACKALVERFEMSHPDLAVHSRIENVDDVLQGEAAVHAYRIVQEAINNTSRHAGARNLWVDVVRDIDHVLLRIRDDGQGMPEAGPPDRRGLGLTSISERCAILGATVSIGSNQPSGASLNIRIFIRNTGTEGDEAAPGDGDG
jgi:signal transduction histidine kinase